MIMPFIRLISIYVIVIVAVVAIFKRDQIMEMTGWSFGATQGEETALVEETAKPQETAMAEETPEVVAAPIVMPKAETTQTQATETATEASTEPAIQTPKPTAAPVVQAETGPAATAGGDTQSRLNAARQSFWQGDLAGAEVLYAALARDEPTNADVNGELGNILYAQRKYDAAAEAYLATGKLLVQTGNRAQVMPLINVLQSIAPEKAATLYALMTN